VLKKPNSFQDLIQLILDGIPIQSCDLTFISSLPRLEILSLPNTRITNEAIAYIVPLKRTLASLNLACNPNLSDDCCINLAYLDSLRTLSIHGTGISMIGLRRFCESVRPAIRMRIELPRGCIDYLKRRSHPQTSALTAANTAYPLIKDPAECSNLSNTALKYNLSVYSLRNPSIPTSGTREELVAKLKAVLESKEADMKVLAVL
ncbi:uncharacterized protein EI90DRAFT_2848997, partial [Cantharellus anzutake]|uniref:uncharacterized protein n=1 Tax=Cantharellus anzutake TaxID=1750568 RepID=UPI0019054B8D